jgi:hypothetical protein
VVGRKQGRGESCRPTGKCGKELGAHPLVDDSLYTSLSWAGRYL